MKTKVNHAALSTEISDQPAIYVGTYAKYNNGSIEGAWVDMTEIEDKEDFLNHFFPTFKGKIVHWTDLKY